VTLRIEIGPDDLAASRFGIAPLAELEFLLRRLRRHERSGGRSAVGGSGAPARWVARYAELRGSLDLRVIRALQPPRWGPDFLAPPPTGMARSVGDDLALVRSTPTADARRDIRLARRAAGPADAEVDQFLAGAGVVERIAELLERLWTQLVAPDWPQLLAIVERDVLHRAEALTRGGWAQALDGLHPDISWDQGTLKIEKHGAQTVQLDGRGLVLVPSVFIHPGMATSLDPPWQPALTYPARGSAALWEERVVAPEALARLLGSGRADLLMRLETPASTTQLSRLSGLALGAVGDHLRVLLEAGFVTRARAGRSVVYRRTAISDAVIAGAAGG
jgi:DNA-binding transcriptional ArsR family regulator